MIEIPQKKEKFLHVTLLVYPKLGWNENNAFSNSKSAIDDRQHKLNFNFLRHRTVAKNRYSSSKMSVTLNLTEIFQRLLLKS